MKKLLIFLVTAVFLVGCSFSPDIDGSSDPAQVSTPPTETDDIPDKRYVCVKDGDTDYELAYALAEVMKPYVTIDAERVYTVRESYFPQSGMVVVETDHGVMFVYMDSEGVLYAVNDVAVEHTRLSYMEIDPTSDIYVRADRCIY